MFNFVRHSVFVLHYLTLNFIGTCYDSGFIYGTPPTNHKNFAKKLTTAFTH
ncbi:hypothetical protein LguiB_008045 [Lonicera macranthoides]